MCCVSCFALSFLSVLSMFWWWEICACHFRCISRLFCCWCCFLHYLSFNVKGLASVSTCFPSLYVNQPFLTCNTYVSPHLYSTYILFVFFSISRECLWRVLHLYQRAFRTSICMHLFSPVLPVPVYLFVTYILFVFAVFPASACQGFCICLSSRAWNLRLCV